MYFKGIVDIPKSFIDIPMDFIDIPTYFIGIPTYSIDIPMHFLDIPSLLRYSNPSKFHKMVWNITLGWLVVCFVLDFPD